MFLPLIVQYFSVLLITVLDFFLFNIHMIQQFKTLMTTSNETQYWPKHGKQGHGIQFLFHYVYKTAYLAFASHIQHKYTQRNKIEHCTKSNMDMSGYFLLNKALDSDSYSDKKVCQIWLVFHQIKAHRIC